MNANPKVLGAFVIGFAMVAGSYVITHFGESNTSRETEAITALTTNSGRDYIPVTDSNNNGIEDWQEEFVNETPLLITEPGADTTNYTPPNTLTDQIGIQLFQSVLLAKGRGQGPEQQAKLVAETADLIHKTTDTNYLYGRQQITVISSSPEAIRTYANTLGSILITTNVPQSESELTIIDRSLRNNDPTELEKLDPLIAMYKALRDETLATPVPKGFEKQHLDLINVYHAMYTTLDSMQLIFTDPVVALLRIQRYQVDASGLGYGLQNMFKAILPHEAIFSAGDPAQIFVTFRPR